MSPDGEAEPPGVSSMRELAGPSHGIPVVGYGSWAEARRDRDAAVVLSGDDGGIVHLTVPLRLVACSAAALATLTSDLDAVSMMNGDPTAEEVAVERLPVGTGVLGGSGGGLVVEGVWTHPGLPEAVHHQAAEVVSGRRDRMDAAVLVAARAAEVRRRADLGRTLPPPDPVVPFSPNH